MMTGMITQGPLDWEAAIMDHWRDMKCSRFGTVLLWGRSVYLCCKREYKGFLLHHEGVLRFSNRYSVSALFVAVSMMCSV